MSARSIRALIARWARPITSAPACWTTSAISADRGTSGRSWNSTTPRSCGSSCWVSSSACPRATPWSTRRGASWSSAIEVLDGDDTMRTNKLRTGLLAVGLFIAGWTAGQLIGGTAQAQLDAPITDPNIIALMMGVASVAVDTEAAAMRINGVADRLAALERRVVQLETQRKR